MSREFVVNIVLDKAKKKRIFTLNIRTCYINTTFIVETPIPKAKRSGIDKLNNPA